MCVSLWKTEFKKSSYRVGLIENKVVPAGGEAVSEGVVVGSPCNASSTFQG